MRRRLRVLGLVLVGAVATVSCSGSEASAPGFAREESNATATFDYTIPLGAGEALDAGTPLEILPATLVASVGDTIQIVNLDDRGHNVGPWFVGANETLRQEFTRPGTFEGVCTVHPSGELVLRVEA